MYLLQILTIFGVFVYMTQPQAIYPQMADNNTKKNNKVKQTDVGKDDSNPNNSKKTMFIADIESHKNNPGPKVVFNDTLQKTLPIIGNNNQTLNNTENKTVKGNTNLTVNKTLQEQSDDLTSGAITRGIMVFVALSFFFVLYVGIKTYRRKSRDKRRTIIKKYGVRARRSDVEMEPLPLSDDDEDETLFDLTASRGTDN